MKFCFPFRHPAVLVLLTAAVLRAEPPASVTAAAGAPVETAQPPAAIPGAHPEAVSLAHDPAVVAEIEKKSREKEAAGLLTLGATLTDRGDYGAAEIAYRQILDNRHFAAADQKNALLGLARLYRKQGVSIKAAAIYERFLKDHPDEERTPDVMLELGRTLRDMGAPKLALNRFYGVINSALKLNAEGFAHYQLLARTAQFEIAETHYASGEFAEASKFFLRLRLLDLAPADRARAHFKAACAQQLDHDYETAVTTLRAYLEQWPDDENVPEARYLLATTLRQLNRSQGALATTLELLQAEQARTARDPRRWAYWQRRTGNQLANEFFQSGNTLNALVIYQSLAALAPEPAWRLPVLYQIALCYERLHQTADARAAYESICATARPAGGEAAPSEEIAELARMASWRITQLDWREKTDRQLNAYFDTTTGRVPPPSKPAAPNPDDPNGSPASAPAAL